ncbi:hypothetical protein BsWGS_24455 [Bradybaena similaris]
MQLLKPPRTLARKFRVSCPLTATRYGRSFHWIQKFHALKLYFRAPVIFFLQHHQKLEGTLSTDCTVVCGMCFCVEFQAGEGTMDFDSCTQDKPISAQSLMMSKGVDADRTCCILIFTVIILKVRIFFDA